MNDPTTSTIPSNAREDALEALTSSKRQQRQSAFYPNTASKQSMPFSKSAAKRDSVMALGSIEHLQYYFAKTGLTSKRKGTQVKGLVPALGPAIIPTVEVSSHTPSASRTSFDIPPPILPKLPATQRPPYPTVDRASYSHHTDPASLKPSLIKDLEDTEKTWHLDPSLTKEPPAPQSSPGGPQLLTAANVRKATSDMFEVLPILQQTTKTVRSVRNYLVALPDDAPHHLQSATTSATHERESSARLRMSMAPQRRVSSTSVTPSGPLSIQPVPFPSPSPSNDPHTRIRKAALEVLSMLRLVEESTRIPLSDDAYDNLSAGSGTGPTGLELPLSMSDEFLAPASGGPQSVSSAPTDRSLLSGDEGDDNESLTSVSAAGSGFRPPRPMTMTVPVKGSSTHIRVWADDEDFDEDPLESPKEKPEPWDRRLVLGGGWLYKQLSWTEMKEQTEVIARYLAIVDEVLFEGPKVDGDPETKPLPYRRGWLRVKASLPTASRIRRTRSSIGPQSPAESEASGPSFAGQGLDSASLRNSGLFNLGAHTTLVAEPEDGLEDVLEGEEEEEDLEYDDGELPDWARRDRFIGNSLARLHALLTLYLPQHLLPYLPPHAALANKDAFVTRLSDGQLLCMAYNAIVRGSKKQWGFIGQSSVHDIIGLEERERERPDGKVVGWTFRRAENLRLWAAALKLRYLVALAPPQPKDLQTNSVIRGDHTGFGPTPSRILAAMGPSTPFDAKIIAKREEGWEKMLGVALEKWVDAIVKERREKEPPS